MPTVISATSEVAQCFYLRGINKDERRPLEGSCVATGRSYWICLFLTRLIGGEGPQRARSVVDRRVHVQFKVSFISLFIISGQIC